MEKDMVENVALFFLSCSYEQLLRLFMTTDVCFELFTGSPLCTSENVLV